jgi:hypothetical protein
MVYVSCVGEVMDTSRFDRLEISCSSALARRGIVPLVMLLVLLAGPTALVVPRTAKAAEALTIVTKERGSGNPALHACYTVADLRDDGGFNGGVGGACDGHDGTADGTTVVTLLGPCSPCRVTQGLPDQPNDQPTDYLLEPSQEGSSGQTYTFENFLKPYIVVSMINAKTKKKFKGACIGVSRPGVAGTGMRICDGVPNGGDQDGRKNGKITTKRLPTPDGKPATLTYEVAGSTPGFAAKAVTLEAEPAKTGEFEKATLKFRRS